MRAIAFDGALLLSLSGATAVAKVTAGEMKTANRISGRSSRWIPACHRSNSVARRDGRYSSRVQDQAALAKVKVGDKVDITWTYAVLRSIE